MKPELEKELEAEISRELEGWPNLAAPPELLTRTMAALQGPGRQRAGSWSKWPVAARVGGLVFALAVVAAVCIGWRAAEPDLVATASRHLAPALVGVSCFWKILCAVTGALALAVEHLGKGFMLAGLAVAAAACALCAGLGTMFVRLALARPGRSSL